jgi:hypothetical protein
MSNQLQKNNTGALSTKVKQIDEAAKEAMEIFKQPGSFEQAISLAQSVVSLREMLTPEVMAPIMGLMNTDLGFRTDRDPKQMVNGERPTPYAVDVVRECFIESALRGFHCAGNEWNIIAGRFYGCQNGFKRKVRELTKGTFNPSFDVPVWSGDLTKARVKCRATWTFNDTKQSIGVEPTDPLEIVVRVNKFMGDDAILGKALRKMSKMVFERITGQSVEEGDAREGTEGAIDIEGRIEATGGEPAFGAASTARPANVTELPLTPKPQPEPPTETPQQKVEKLMTDALVPYTRFLGWGCATGRLESGSATTDEEYLKLFPDYKDLPAPFCIDLLADKKAVQKCIALCARKAT